MTVLAFAYVALSIMTILSLFAPVRAFTRKDAETVFPPLGRRRGQRRELAELEARMASYTEPEHLAALTVADVAVLQALGWEPPVATTQRVQRALDAATRPPRVARRRTPPSDHQRALAEMTDARIAGQWGGTPSQRQQILANEADARVARGAIHPMEDVQRVPPLDWTHPFRCQGTASIAGVRHRVFEQGGHVYAIPDPDRSFGGSGLHTGNDRYETIVSADGFQRRIRVPDHSHDPRCHCGAC